MFLKISNAYKQVSTKVIRKLKKQFPLHVFTNIYNNFLPKR